MSRGVTASLALTFGGGSASAFGQEADLAIDAGGDLLSIDAGGDVLIVTPSVMTFTGASASSYGAEVDLAIDAAGDLLSIDGPQQGSGGDVLIVTPGLSFAGATASFVVADRAVALEGEGWTFFETEGGQAIESEGT